MLHGDQNVFQSDVLPSVSSALVQNEVQYRLLAKITASDIECLAFNSNATTLLVVSIRSAHSVGGCRGLLFGCNNVSGNLKVVVDVSVQTALVLLVLGRCSS